MKNIYSIYGHKNYAMEHYKPCVLDQACLVWLLVQSDGTGLVQVPLHTLTAHIQKRSHQESLLSKAIARIK